MPALGDGALQTRVEDIAGEEGQDLGLSGVSRSGVVVVDDGLEARYSADRVSRAFPGGPLV